MRNPVCTKNIILECPEARMHYKMFLNYNQYILEIVTEHTENLPFPLRKNSNFPIAQSALAIT